MDGYVEQWLEQCTNEQPIETTWDRWDWMLSVLSGEEDLCSALTMHCWSQTTIKQSRISSDELLNGWYVLTTLTRLDKTDKYLVKNAAQKGCTDASICFLLLMQWQRIVPLCYFFCLHETQAECDPTNVCWDLKLSLQTNLLLFQQWFMSATVSGH